ncbi:MAG: glutamate-1-semialdehyde 2,1-aminomutase [Kiritimatiellae bacterium]|nr:glutamate-1-semialdehyde 2,1-aminomutase [Kiritimatiellia bacterium]
MTHSELFQRACAVIPGGVNSPVRAFNAVGGTPLFITSGKGSRITTADGRTLIDCCCSWGAMILGHAAEVVTEAVAKAAEKGTTFGIATPGEIDLAERLVAASPLLESVRLVNSGTEAVMTAVRLARGVTGRDVILKCEGCYHGHSDGLLVSAGSGVRTAGDGAEVACAGSPRQVAKDTLVIPYNDLAAAERAFAAYGDQIAAVIVEPVAGNMGCVPPVEGYLKGLERVAHRSGALLICDEVINAFRFRYGLYSDTAGIAPDIITMGKVIGGGFPLAAVGAKTEIMRALAPCGKVYQAGTLSGNPVAVAAAIAVLNVLKANPPYAEMAAKAARVTTAINEAAARAGVPLRAQRYETVFTPFATDALPMRNLTEAQRSDAALYARFFHGMLARGVYFEPSQFEVNFISAAHTDADVEAICAAATETLMAL